MSQYQQMLPQLQQIIREAAKAELLPRFRCMERQFKADGSIVTEADHAMQAAVQAELQQHWPDIALLGEEMTEAEQSALMESSHSGLWVLDPLDGTSNFAAGIPCFSVSLALLKDGEVKLGIIYDPLLDESYSAIAGMGAWLNDTPLSADDSELPLSKCIAQVDFKRLTGEMAARIASNPPYGSQRSFGSGALDWCWVAVGRVQLYLHGKQKLWDYSAGQLILREAGGHCCTLNEEEVFQGKLEPRSVIAATHGNHFKDWKNCVLNK